MKKVKTVTEETINDTQEEIKDDERKADKFFHFFKNEENYVISLYKVRDRGKAELVEKYENQVPDMMKVREIWGGGTYKLYAHDFNNVLLDTAVIHVAQPPEEFALQNRVDEETILKKMMAYKQLFSGENNGNNEIILKMMEMQNQFSQSISSLIAKMNEKNLEVQLQMEKRFSELIEKQSSQKNGFSELIQAAEFINMIKGESGEQSLFEKIIGNPIFQNIASGFVENLNQPPKQIMSPQISSKEKPNLNIPQNFIDKLTRENKEKGIDNLIRVYKISKVQAETIVEEILKNKGL